jgi:hypothetical protein
MSTTAPPSRDEFLDVLDELLGERHPDFQCEAERIEAMARAVRAQDRDESDRLADDLLRLQGAPLELAEHALAHWEQLSAPMKRSVTEQLQGYIDVLRQGENVVDAPENPSL